MSRLRIFADHQKGGAAIVFAISIMALFGFGAMAVDVGSFYFEKRKLQTANDLAALAAASDIPRAQAAAQASVTQNGFAGSNIRSLQPGIYTPDPGKPPEARFVPGPATTANAVRIDMGTTTPLLLGRVLSASTVVTKPVQAAAPSQGPVLASVSGDLDPELRRHAARTADRRSPAGGRGARAGNRIARPRGAGGRHRRHRRDAARPNPQRAARDAGNRARPGG